MALILEIRDIRGHPTWHPLGRLPLTLGRALSNDIIVDDPYVDAVHARILLDDAGAAVIMDGGTVNGIVTERGVRASGAVRLDAGTELRIGRTVLRVRALDEALPPALVETRQPGEAATPPAGGELPVHPETPLAGPIRPLRRWAAWTMRTTAGRLAVTGAMLAALAVNSWWGNTEESSGMSVFTTVLGVAFLVLLWASVWGAAARGADRRFHLAGHLAVASLAMLALLAYTIANEWLTFLFPDLGILPIIDSAVMLGVVTWIVAAHLAVPNLLTRRKRWRAGFIVSGVLVALIGVGTLLDSDEFSDVPVFEQQLKHLPSSVVPYKTTAQFLGMMREVKERADEAATASQSDR